MFNQCFFDEVIFAIKNLFSIIFFCFSTFSLIFENCFFSHPELEPVLSQN